MANPEHLATAMKGAAAIAEWRALHAENHLDLNRADLRNADLSLGDLSGASVREADLSGADLSGANLRRTDLSESNLSTALLVGADLREAKLYGADLRSAHLSGANLAWTELSKAYVSGALLDKANLFFASLFETDLSDADLREADLSMTMLAKTCVSGSVISGSRVWGASVWDLRGDPKEQRDLIITPHDEAPITVDNLKVAQFIYLLLTNQEIREVIDTITSKAVLILGRFTPERKRVLDAIRNVLRERRYTPILFDFDKPATRDLTETILVLAALARFVIADITDAKSIPQELSHIIPNLPSVPVQPVLLSKEPAFAMFEHWRNYPWVLPEFLYENEEQLLASLVEKVIQPAERRRQEQAGGRISQ